MNVNNVLYPNEKVLCSIGGKYRILAYTSVRLIFFDKDSFYSLTLDNVVSIHYIKILKTFYLYLGFIFLFFSIFTYYQSRNLEFFSHISFGLFLIAACSILYYFLSKKSLLEITTKSSQKITHEVGGNNPEKIKIFCN